MKTHLLILAALLTLAACASSPGAVTGGIVAGIGGFVAVVDQLLADGIIDPVQHFQMVQSVEALQRVAEAAAAGVETVKRAQEGTLTVEQGVGGAVALATTVLGAVRVWRGQSSKATKKVA